MIDIIINDVSTSINSSTTLEQLQQIHSNNKKGIVVALNNTIIAKVDWPNTTLTKGDRISIFQVIAGG